MYFQAGNFLTVRYAAAFVPNMTQLAGARKGADLCLWDQAHMCR